MVDKRTKGTRQLIQRVALEFFSERGYEKTALREIAERLQITKAAVYYHFRTKEDILISLFDEAIQPVDALIEWAIGQPCSTARKHELLARYSVAIFDAADFFRFMLENQAAVQELGPGKSLRQSIRSIRDLLSEGGSASGIAEHIRATAALATVQLAVTELGDSRHYREDQRKAFLQVAQDMVSEINHR
ncbi:TetR/AcrR family transcriptional regulator [Streptomyces sp. NPDC056296]|uniref:TetR/AcrR family transcriptional regulator n=1 Tax=Streptomyces sp. NPDC056296 TaxID=3345775 RepID=UPI0035D9A4FF